MRIIAVMAALLVSTIGCLVGPAAKNTEQSVTGTHNASKVDGADLSKSANSPTAHVSGGGQVENAGDIATFNVNAKTQKGITTGHAQFSSTSGIEVRIDIDCLDVVGNVAVLSGILTEATLPFVVGTPVIFSMIDNGEGHKIIDQISRPLTSAALCTAPPILFLENLTGGNVQIH